jgi:hypothetical protein
MSHSDSIKTKSEALADPEALIRTNHVNARLHHQKTCWCGKLQIPTRRSLTVHGSPFAPLPLPLIARAPS